MTVVEAPGVSGYNFTTTYTYDALDDLTRVSQNSGGKTRTFTYSSLKRLIAANNPENYTPTYPASLTCSGVTNSTTCYQYDPNGNLTLKEDNRGYITSYLYDSLNRTKSKSYSNAAGTINYQGVSYSYACNAAAHSCGRLTSVSTLPGTYTAATDVSTTNYTNYDALGRIVTSNQITNGVIYPFTYTYNLADSLTSESYPSGRLVYTCYDTANRTSQVGLNASCSASAGYAYNFQYAAHGAPTQYVVGTNLWYTASYNYRLQLTGPTP